MFKVNNKDTRTASWTPFWCLCCKYENEPFSRVSIVGFEQGMFARFH